MRNFRRVILLFAALYGVFGITQTSQAWWGHRWCGGRWSCHSCWSGCANYCFVPRCCYTPCCYHYAPCCYSYAYFSAYVYPSYAAVTTAPAVTTYAVVARKPSVTTVSSQLAVSPTGQGSGAYRTWIDNTGRHSIQAKFVQVNGDKIRLKKDNGDVIEVAMNKLSDTDQFVAKQFSHSDVKIASTARGF